MNNQQRRLKSDIAPPLTRRNKRATLSLLMAMSLFLAWGCKKTSRTVTPAFYHWRTELNPTEAEQQYLQKLGAKALYTKFFDVDWDENRGQAVPLAILQADGTTLPDSLPVIPTVFITNETFKNLDEAAVDTLARRLHDKVFELAEGFSHSPIREIQIDCDWSQTTRAAYFRLLDQLRRELQPKGISLSTTIRLHQIRYREQTGVPPVDRGLLMCYNTGEVEDWNESNSILRRETAAPYLDRLRNYPLPLDLALPIFHWGVLFRDGEMIRLINNLAVEDLSDTERFVPMSDDRYEVKQSTFLQGHYLYGGDRLRLEAVPFEELEAVSTILSARWPTTDFRVAFYHLDTETIANYPFSQLERLCEVMGLGG